MQSKRDFFSQKYYYKMHEEHVENIKTLDSRGIRYGRLLFIYTIIALCYFIIIFRMFDASLSKNANIVLQHYPQNNKKITNHRANILDRNGNLLATNILTSSLYAHPNQMNDKKTAAILLNSILPELSATYLESKLTSGKNFVWLKRHLSPDIKEKIQNLGIPGIYFFSDYKRFYTHGHLFSHVLGYLNLDNKGVSGIERSMDEELNSTHEIKLTLDSRLQFVVYNELYNAIKKNEAVSGAAIVMDANNGEILSMVSLPDFDPHFPEKSPPQSLFPIASFGLYEMGSAFKLITMASAIDSNTTSIHDVFDVSYPFKIGRFRIGDYRGKGGKMSTPEVLMYSSNIGISQIASKLGLLKQQLYLKKLGMFDETQIELCELSKPIYPKIKNWSDIHLATISFGHGIAVTPLHVAQAVSTIVNGGFIVKPTLRYSNNQQLLTRKRVFSKKTSDLMRKLMYLVITSGSGIRSNLYEYPIGGKTGTAEKIKSGRYDKNNNIAIFVGAVPITKPKYVLFIMIDEPKANSYNGGAAIGSRVAAPAAKEIFARMGRVLNIQPNSEETSQEMFLAFTPRRNMLAKR